MATKFDNLLKELQACREARNWAKGKTFTEVWQTCERGDWLLWLCAKMNGKVDWPNHKTIMLATCDCAELGFKYLKEGETRPQECIATIRQWAYGKVTIEDVRKGRCAVYADAAYAAAYAADAAAAYAAHAYAVDAADAAAYAAHAYAAAVYADAAYAAAYAYALQQMLKTCANLIRIRITQPKFDD